MARTRGKAKKRERPLGAAIGFGLLVTFGVALAIFMAMMLIPGTALHYFFQISLHQSSATLQFDPLFQQWKEDINREDALFVSPFSLLCGGLTLGWLAPHYAMRRRILLSAAAMAFGFLVISLAFTWSDALVATSHHATSEGGYVARLIAPLDLIVRQNIWDLIWIAVCVLGAWLGLRLRDRRSPQGNDAAPALRAAPR
ncbi:MAG: hypothetical protein M3Y13_06925 [Armatimonadota bacterium]|nr:hypothetical protein [Armatimonadota bacterium]